MIRAAVYINAGLGDALLMIPLLKNLKATGRIVTGIFQSQYFSDVLFKDTGLLDNAISIQDSMASLFGLVKDNYKAFDEVYLSYLAATKENILTSRLIGRKIIGTLEGKRLWLLLGANATTQPPATGIHAAIQNLRLSVPHATNDDMLPDMMAFSEDTIARCFSTAQPTSIDTTLPYIAIQPTAANNLFAFKTWPLEYWIEWLKMASKAFRSHQFILLGDKNEQINAQIIMQENIPGVASLVGKTNLSEVMNIIKQSSVLVGHDSGLMHIAASLKKPTFIVWGGSSPSQFGYEWLNPKMHRDVSSNPSCGPCNVWVGRNTSRFKNAVDCTDHACLWALHPELVFQEFRSFFKGLSLT